MAFRSRKIKLLTLLNRLPSVAVVFGKAEAIPKAVHALLDANPAAMLAASYLGFAIQGLSASIL